MRSKTSLAFVLLLTAFALAACGGGDDDEASTGAAEPTATTSEPGGAGTATAPGGNAPAPSGEAPRAAKVRIVGYAFDPDPVTIQVGGKVTWQNEDPVPHTATAEDGSFDTGPIEEGKLKSETFKQPGTFTYVCTIHPGMHGTVEVVEKG